MYPQAAYLGSRPTVPRFNKLFMPCSGTEFETGAIDSANLEMHVMSGSTTF